MLNVTVFLIAAKPDVIQQTRSVFSNVNVVSPIMVDNSDTCGPNSVKQKGVLQSHLEIWRKSHHYNAFLVLEEDWKFASSVQQAMNTIEKALSIREEYAAIGYCGVDMACTQAYVMKNSLATKLACFDRCMFHNNCNVDWFISSLYGAGLITAKIFPFERSAKLFGRGVIQQNRGNRRLKEIYPFYHDTCKTAVQIFRKKSLA